MSLSSSSVIHLLTFRLHAHRRLQREQLEADREQLRSDFEQLVAQQQERAAEWEEAAKQEEAALGQHKQARAAAPVCTLKPMISKQPLPLGPCAGLFIAEKLRRLWKVTPWTPAARLFALLQEVEAAEQRLQRRTEELSGVERRITAAQQRLDGEAERLRKAMAGLEEEGAGLRVGLASARACVVPLHTAHCLCVAAAASARAKVPPHLPLHLTLPPAPPLPCRPRAGACR